MSRKSKISANEALEQILNDETDSEAEQFLDSESEVQYLPGSDYESDSSHDEVDFDQNMDPFNSDDGNDNDDHYDGDDNDEDQEETLVGTSGKVWSSKPPVIHRRQAQDILKERMGPKNCGYILGASSAFGLFLTNEIVLIIVRYTNQYARSVIYSWNTTNPDKQKEWKPLTDVECRAFIGLLLLAGVYRSNHESLDELWSVEAGRPVFRATMALHRFKTILRYCRFDDKNTRTQRRENDKLAPVRDIWEMFNLNLRSHYKPGAYLTIDEQLVPFRGRCSFRQYMMSKPAKYGIKIWWICDSSSTFPLLGQVYLGKSNNGEREVNQGMRVVKDLVSPWLNTGRNVTTDNFFTSIPLAEELLRNNTTIVGTLRNNKREIPHEMKPNNKRAVLSSMFGFCGNLSIVSYVPKKGKAVNLLSTLHHDQSVPEDNPSRKPEVVLFYNQTKGGPGVDNLDKLVSTYTCRRKTLRWPMVTFFNMLDVAGVAAFLVWISEFPDGKAGLKSRRRTFIRELGNQLINEYIETRMQNQRALQKGVRSGLTAIGYNVCALPTPGEPSAKKRCFLCPRIADRKTKTTCSSCSRSICKKHSAAMCICEDCCDNA